MRPKQPSKSCTTLYSPDKFFELLRFGFRLFLHILKDIVQYSNAKTEYYKDNEGRKLGESKRKKKRNSNQEKYGMLL